MPSTPESEDRPGHLKRRTARGLLWTAGTTAVGFVVQIGYTAAMGRLVDPAAFGLVAAAGVLISILSLVSNFGINSAIIQRENVDGSDLRCAFTYSVLIGLTITIIAFLLAPAATSFMRVSGLTPLIRVISLSLFITSFGVVAEGSLRRRLNYRAVSIIDLSAMTCGFVFVGIPMAVAGANQWSLVCAQLTYSTIDAVVLILVARHSLLPIFSWARARRFVLFGGGVSLLSLFEYAGLNLDTIAVGRYLGAADLGQYSRATMLFGLPAEKVTVSFSSVLYPALARVQSSRERVRSMLHDSLGGVTMLVMPACILAGVAAPAAVRVVLGPSWGPAASVLPILALASALGLVTHIIALTFEAVGRLHEKFVIQGCRVVIFLTSIVSVVVVGPTLTRFSLAWLGAQIFDYFAYVVAARLRLGSSAAAMALQMGRAVTTGVVCAIPSFLVIRVAGQHNLLGGVVGAAGAAAILILLWRTPVMADARSALALMRDGLRREPSSPEMSDPSVIVSGHALDVIIPPPDHTL